MEFKRAGFITKIVVVDLARQVTDQRLENQKLEDAIANSDDPEMLEQVARERGYVKQNETLFIDVAN